MTRSPTGNPEARAHALENAARKKQEAAAAVLEWEQAQEAEAAKTARLRALRLARDAAAKVAQEPQETVKKKRVRAASA